MTLLIAIDACAALHGKALGQDAATVYEGLGFLTDLAVRAPAKLVCTHAVRSEQVDMSLRDTILDWEARGIYSAEKERAVEVKRMRNQVKRGMKMPGKHDLGLIALAEQRNATLLTHETAAAELAQRVRVLTVDLLDLADLSTRLGILPPEQVDSLFTAWDLPTDAATWRQGGWRPRDWAGSAMATINARPNRQATLDKLIARLERSSEGDGAKPDS